MYTAYTGKEYDYNGDGINEKGYILDYKFYIEVDEVNGTQDTAYSLLGNESMGNNAAFNFVDKLDEVAPNATLIGCSMKGRYYNQDGYVGGNDPVTFSGTGSIKSTVDDIHIPQPDGAQQISCTQNGSDINVSVSGVDATLDKYPTKNYNEQALPVNRAIAAIGNIYVFVPLSDVEAGNDGISGNADDGEIQTKNKLRGFDPTTPTGTSNFGSNSEALNDNDYNTTLYAFRGSFSKYYRGEENGV